MVLQSITGSTPSARHPRFGAIHAADRICTTALSTTIALLAVPIAFLASGKVRRILLTVVVLNISFSIEKHFFLREEARDLGSIGGLQVSLTNIALMMLYIGWLVRIVIQSRDSAPLRWSSNKLTLPGALLLFFYAISLFVAGDTTLGVFEVWRVLELFLLYLYITGTTTSREDVLFIVRILLVGLIIQSLLMMAQAAGLVGDIDFYGIKARAEFAGDSRVSGTIGSPNPAAAYLAMMMPVALGVMLAGVGRRDKYLAGIGLAAAIMPLIFTSSRGGWLAFVVGFATVVIFGRRRVPWKTLRVVAVALVLLAIPFSGAIKTRLESDDNGSAAARMPLNRLAMIMIEDHPLLGVGANNFAVAMEPYLAHGFSGDFLYTVHNTYLLVWTETGIGGLIALVWLLVAIVRQGLKCWQSRDSLFAPLALGCTAAVLGFMVQMLFDPYRGGTANHLLWLFAGLVAVMNSTTLNPMSLPQPGTLPVLEGVPMKLARP